MDAAKKFEHYEAGKVLHVVNGREICDPLELWLQRQLLLKRQVNKPAKIEYVSASQYRPDGTRKRKRIIK